MGRPLNKKYFGNRNIGSTSVTTDDGIGGQGVDSVTLGGTNNSTGFTAGAADIAFAAPTLPGGVTATGSLVLYADGALLEGVTTLTASGLGVDGGGAGAATYTGVTQKSSDGSGTGAVLTVVKANTNGVTDYSDITVTITSGGTGYIVGEELVIDGADVGGVTVTNDLALVVTGFVTDGTIQSITVVEAGSGYESAPTVTLSNGTKGTLTTTAVLTTDSGAPGSATNQENAIIAYAYVTGGSNKVGDIVKQVSSRRYKVKTADGTMVCTLVTDGVADAAGEMTITATDSSSKTYYVKKLTAHKALLVPFGTAGHEFAANTSVQWTFGAATLNSTVTIANK